MGETIFDLHIPPQYMEEAKTEEILDENDILEKSLLEEVYNAVQQLGVIVWVFILFFAVDLSLEYAQRLILWCWRKTSARGEQEKKKNL